MLIQERKRTFLANTFSSMLLILFTGALAGCNRGKFVCPIDKQDKFPLPLADPNDCQFFHICYTMKKVWRDRCGPEAHFNGTMCVEGWCPTALPGCKPLDPPVNSGSLSIRPPVTGYFDCLGKIGYGHTDEYPDPNDCKYFFICYSEQRVVRMSCGDGQYFDGDICVPGECPSKIPGAEPLKPKPTNCSMKIFECPTNKLRKHADPNDCKSYFICYDLNIIARDRCETGHHFDGKRCIPGECPPTFNDTCQTGHETTPYPASSTAASETDTPTKLAFPTVTTETVMITRPPFPSVTTETVRTRPRSPTTTTEAITLTRPTFPTATTNGIMTTRLTSLTITPMPETPSPPCYVERFVCSRYSIGSHPNPADCRYYIKCINLNFAVIEKSYDCGAGYHFQNQYCRIGPCPRICQYNSFKKRYENVQNV